MFTIFLLFNRNAKVPVELLEENENLYMADESITINEINGSDEHEWNVNSNLVNQFCKIDDNCIDILMIVNIMMYNSNNITKKDSMNILINKSKSLNIQFNNDRNVTKNEGILIDDLDINDDVNRLNTQIDKYIDQFVMVEISLE